MLVREPWARLLSSGVKAVHTALYQNVGTRKMDTTSKKVASKDSCMICTYLFTCLDEYFYFANDLEEISRTPRSRRAALAGVEGDLHEEAVIKLPRKDLRGGHGRPERGVG